MGSSLFIAQPAQPCPAPSPDVQLKQNSENKQDVPEPSHSLFWGSFCLSYSVSSSQASELPREVRKVKK